MAGIARRLYDGWDHFARSLRPELFDGEPFAPDRYVFRGMSDANWRLVSSFDRQFPGHVDRGRLSSALLRGFRAASEEWLDREILDDEDRLLALGQHHGLPTRLLDWSTSPYVAAFFALSGALTTRGPAERHVSVWALHLDAPVWTADLGVAFLPPAGGGNVRMRSQGGCFTRSLTPFASLEEYVVPRHRADPAVVAGTRRGARPRRAGDDGHHDGAPVPRPRRRRTHRARPRAACGGRGSGRPHSAARNRRRPFTPGARRDLITP